MCICHPRYGKISEAPTFEWTTTPIVPEPERPAPVDPADVRVGDVVEVEADHGSWLVRGEVVEVDPGSESSLAIHFTNRQFWPPTANATVRVLSRAVPDGLATLRRIVRDLAGEDTQMSDSNAADRLWAAGVRVVKEEQ